jgi:hypothetical protein
MKCQASLQFYHFYVNANAYTCILTAHESPHKRTNLDKVILKALPFVSHLSEILHVHTYIHIYINAYARAHTHIHAYAQLLKLAQIANRLWYSSTQCVASCVPLQQALHIPNAFRNGTGQIVFCDVTVCVSVYVCIRQSRFIGRTCNPIELFWRENNASVLS